jgi:hypothetical protein
VLRRLEAEHARHRRVGIDEAAAGQAAEQAFGGVQIERAVALALRVVAVLRQTLRGGVEQGEDLRAVLAIDALGVQSTREQVASGVADADQEAADAPAFAQLRPDRRAHRHVRPEPQLQRASAERIGKAIAEHALQRGIGFQYCAPIGAQQGDHRIRVPEAIYEPHRLPSPGCIPAALYGQPATYRCRRDCRLIGLSCKLGAKGQRCRSGATHPLRFRAASARPARPSPSSPEL